jgi:hypothetical protein
MTKAYERCVKRGYHNWCINGVYGGDPGANELEVFCSLCESEGDAVVNVRNANDGGDE